MPRKARIVVPGALHHVMARGIDGRDIFVDDQDRTLFLSVLEGNLRRGNHRLYAWTLIPNHYHLLVRTSDAPLSEMMGRVNSTYARAFNKKYGRKGYLFQDRYKSIVTQDQGYAEELVRYIHLNPIRAGLCKSLAQLERYQWCGHGVIMGRRDWAMQDVAPVLARFGRTTATARKAYCEYLAEGLDAESSLTVDSVRKSNSQKESRMNPACWVIGDSEFVKKAMSMHERRTMMIARHKKEGITLEHVAKTVCRRFGISTESLLKRSRGTAIADARKVFAYVCRREYGFPVNEIARFLGICSPPASICIRLGEKIAAQM